MHVECSRWWTAFIVVALCLPGGSQETAPAPPRPKVRVDLYGDPLPDGAIARLGTIRFRHPGGVRAVAFSTDGKTLAASNDGNNAIIIWDRTSGRKLREIPLDSKVLPSSLRFSHDGERLYGLQVYPSYYKDSVFHAWDVKTGSEIKGFPQPVGRGCVPSFSSDGRKLIFLQEKELEKEKEVILWDIESGKVLSRYPLKWNRYQSSIALFGDRVLYAQFDGQSVSVEDVARKERLLSVEAIREKDDSSVMAMTFSADGALFAVEAPRRAISIYQSLTGKMVRRLKADVVAVYYSLCISPNAQTVAGSNWDGSLHLWWLKNGQENARIRTIPDWATHVFFAPDSKTFATGGRGSAHAVLLWDTATGKQIEPFPGHTSPISSISFSPDGRTLATCSWIRQNKLIGLWDPGKGRLLHSLENPDGGGVNSVSFSPDGRMLAAGSWTGDRKVRIWDVRTGKERHALAGHDSGCTCVAFSPDGKRLASGGIDRLLIWDTEAGKLVLEIPGTRGVIHRVLFTNDGRYILASAAGIHIYHSDTGQLVREPFEAQRPLSGLALSGDDRLLATATGKGPPRLWELASGREIPLNLSAGNVYDVGLSHDGLTLANGGEGGSFVLYHWPSGATLGRFIGDPRAVWRLAFSPDGHRLATTEHSHSSVLIWPVADLVNRQKLQIASVTQADLQRWWADLGEEDSRKAYQAIQSFSAVPKHALPFLAGLLKPSKAPEPAAVAQMIHGLGSDKFGVREKASRELRDLGELAVGPLRAARKGNTTAEQARRIDRLLSQLAGPVPSSEELRQIRALAALEQIGGAEVQKVIARLASGASETRLTLEAKGSLQRLKGQAR